MTAHRQRSGIDRPYALSGYQPKPTRTAGMRAKSDGPILPMATQPGFWSWLRKQA